MATILAAATFAIGAGQAVSGFLGQRQQQRAQEGFQLTSLIQAARHRDEVMRYQNQVWQQDLEFATVSLGYQTAEFNRQIGWTQEAGKAVARNRDAEAFTLMVRGIEETIATTFQGQQASRQGQATRARMGATERNVEGNSVEAVLNDVSRQEGEAQTVLEMNRDVIGRQLFREALAGDARADAEMSQIASSVRTFAPNAPIRTPTPVNALNPQAPTAGPPTAALAAGIGNAAVGAFNTYNSLSGQNGRQTIDQLSGWVSRQFSFGGSPTSRPVSSTPLAPGVG